MIKFDFHTYTNKIIDAEEKKSYEKEYQNIYKYLKELDYMASWYDIKLLSQNLEIDKIKKKAEFIKANADVLLVIGIGGSYLGSQAVIDSLSPYFYNEKNNLKIYYLGLSLSSDYLNDLWELIKDKEIIVNVISKSGNTTEISIAYDYIKEKLKQKYTDLKTRIIITTDLEEGSLRQEAKKEGFDSFDIPRNIGGRYSLFTAAHLLPIATLGIDIDELINGGIEALSIIDDSIKYAINRDILIKKGYVVESYVTYEPKLYYVLEWLKQLYGESLGKEKKGLLPISFINTRDLHSLGQFVQEGKKLLFETVIKIENSNQNIYVDKYQNYMNEINNIALESVATAHMMSDVSTNIIILDKLSAKNIGYLLQFFMISCVISSYFDNINPFDQNGVEDYKKEMKDRLRELKS